MPENRRDKMAEIVALRETSTALLRQGATDAAASEKARAKRLEVVLERLGPDHPRAARLKERLVRATARRDGLIREVKRISKRPKKREAWAVVGQVCDPDGRPVKGLDVKLVGEHNELNEKLKGVKSDANGDFVLAYTAADLGDLVGEARALSLTVKKGNTVLYSSPTTLAFVRWRTDYFELTVGR